MQLRRPSGDAARPLAQALPDYPGFLARQASKRNSAAAMPVPARGGRRSVYECRTGEPVRKRCGAPRRRSSSSKRVGRSWKFERGNAKRFASAQAQFQVHLAHRHRESARLCRLFLAFFPGSSNFYEREYREGVRPHMTTAYSIGRLGFVGVSGEPFTSHSIQLKRRARLDRLLPSLAIATITSNISRQSKRSPKEATGADTTVAPAEVGAGERIMDQALMDFARRAEKLGGRRSINPANSCRRHRLTPHTATDDCPTAHHGRCNSMAAWL